MKLIQGDCLEILPTLETESVDLILTDPPYGMDYQSNFSNKRMDKIANDERPFIWWLYHAFKITRDGGALVCFSDWKNQEAFRFAIELAGFKIKSQVIWAKHSGGLGDLNSSFLPQHEIAWFAVKGKFSFYDKRPLSVIDCSKVPPGQIVHPNQKPAGVLAAMIRALTPKGGVVLDPFVGSGSTGIAAFQTGRDFIGIELDPEYFAIAEKRIANAQPALF